MRLLNPATHALTAHPSAPHLYLALYFIPETLHSNNDIMAAVVSKLFRLNWVVSWAPGQLADVDLQWQRYRYSK